MDKNTLPENTIESTASKAGDLIKEISEGCLRIPIDGVLGNSKGLLIVTIPNGVKIDMELIIPIESNVTNPNITLTESMGLLNKARSKVTLLGVNEKIKEKYSRISIVISGNRETFNKDNK